MSAVTSELGLVALAAMMSPTTLTFSVLVLVLGKRPLRSGGWFYAGAVLATLSIGVIAAFTIGDIAASPQPSTPKTPVAVIDLVAGALILLYVLRHARRPPSRERIEGMIARMGSVVDSPVTAIVAAGATLANPGGFIPLALKDISETNPTAGQYMLEWIVFTLVSLLPLSLALASVAIAPQRTQRVLLAARDWLTSRAQTVAAAILLLLAAILLRNGIAGLTG